MEDRNSNHTPRNSNLAIAKPVIKIAKIISGPIDDWNQKNQKFNANLNGSFVIPDMKKPLIRLKNEMNTHSKILL
jgi:hypothetical protein